MALINEKNIKKKKQWLAIDVEKHSFTVGGVKMTRSN